MGPGASREAPDFGSRTLAPITPRFGGSSFTCSSPNTHLRTNSLTAFNRSSLIRSR
jgi:hypothetical protein